MILQDKILILLFPILILIGCSTTYRISDADIEAKALKIAEIYDSSSIDIFKNWNCIPRGQFGIWQKISDDDMGYRWVLFKLTDSIEIKIFDCENFINDFKAAI